MRAIKGVLACELQSPSDELVRFCAKKVYTGTLTAKLLETFCGRVKRAYQQLINEQINERLKSAMVDAPKEAALQANITQREVNGGPSGPQVDTSVEEIVGYHAVKAILRQVVDQKLIIMRDTLSYCGILLDDNNLKGIGRLHFNGKQKYLGLLREDKTEERIAIATVDDIYAYAERMK